MDIIIVGVGTVGAAICSGLAEEGHNITVLDSNETAVEELTASYDVTGIVGSGADVSSLRAAGAERADLLIAITPSDELNILCCFGARKLGTKNTVARVRNPDYTELTELTRQDLGLSFTINPEFAVAREIARVLRLPAAAKVDTFCDGRVETVELKLHENSPLVECTLHELREKIGVNFLVSGVRRRGSVFIPLGSTVLEADDTVTVTVSEENTAKFFKAIGSYKRPVKNVLIVGGGRTTYYLAERLRRAKADVTVIEADRQLCTELAEDFDFTVIHGDGTKQELLVEEGIEKADAFLALSDVDEENALTSMFAKTKNVPRVITMIRSLSYIDFFKSVGLESIVSPKHSTVNQILRFVRAMADSRASEIVSLHKLMDGSLEALEFSVKESISGLTDTPLRDVKRKANTLVACIVRGKEIIIPSGDDEIRVSDRVIIVTMKTNMDSIKDILK